MLQKLRDKVSKANGRRRTRIIDDAEIKDFIELFQALKDDDDIHTIRVYSYSGFVSNSYKYRADITYLEASRNPETKEWSIYASTTDAKRSYGSGSLVTVNGRAYDN